MHKYIPFDRSLRGISASAANNVSSANANEKINEAYARGRMEAENFYNQQILEYKSQLVALSEGLINNIQKRYDDFVGDVQSRLPGLVAILVRRIWSGILWDEHAVRAMIEEVLHEYAISEEPLEIFLSAHDVSILENLDISRPYGSIVFKEDITLGPGDCLVRSRFGMIDARLETKLQKIENELEQSLGKL